MDLLNSEAVMFDRASRLIQFVYELKNAALRSQWAPRSLV